jgi:hypothetical protein
MALAAGAFMIFRRPARSDAASEANTNQPTLATTTPDASNANAGASASKTSSANPAPSDAERAAAEKKAADERKQKEEQQKEEAAKANKNEAPAPAPATAPATPEPAQQTENEPPAAPGTACAIVWVTGATDPSAAAGLRVLVEEQGTGAMYNARTGPKGRCRVCGPKPGNQVRVVVFGRGGAMLGTKTQVLKAGLNIVQVQLTREPGMMPQTDAGSPMPMRKRPRFRQP